MPPRKRRRDVEEPAEGASPLPDDEARDAANTDRSPPPALDARAAAAAAVLAEELAEEDGNGEDAAEAGRAAERRERAGRASRDCPYLDTVSRSLLDFDFEKCCSVTLSPNNVYACLSCGKYFQGRGPNTQAYTHSLEATHHVFMNLESAKVYCLPEGYEVVDRSLDDIRYVLNPSFTPQQVGELDAKRHWSRGLDGTDYLTGAVGLNNLKATDYVNVVLQALMRVSPVRNFFLAQKAAHAGNQSLMVQRFGELTRKVWNSRNFKGQVSPHEFMQAVLAASKRRFLVDAQGDPMEFLMWLLHTLHHDLSGKKKGGKSVINRCFQGELEVTTVGGDAAVAPEKMPFYMLALDLPQAPLFQDVMEKNTIPQVPLYQILQKFDGETEYEVLRGGRKKFKVSRLPRYLIVHHKRFTRNNFFVEKNPTIVTFPVKNLQLSDHIPVPNGPDGKPAPSKYNLVANICHDGKPEVGSYRAMVYHRADGNWYETQDLTVTEVLPQQVVLTECYLQIYELQPEVGSAGAAAGAALKAWVGILSGEALRAAPSRMD
uniref:Ubiquitinyl hydrolase 1 n=1 Tax=Mantoniella antarctica TaxID=81844 RepID=A0A7S0XB69_9CHLO